MATRAAFMIGIIFLILGAVIAAVFTGQHVSSASFHVKFSPREEDGTQLAVDFVRDLAAGRFQTAWERTSLSFREENDYDGLAEQVRRAFHGCREVTIEAGDQPHSIVGRIDHAELAQESITFSVEADNSDDGLMRIRRVSFSR